MEHREILLKNIHPNPNNPRVEAGDVTDLAASIKEVGLQDPLLVIPAPWLRDIDEPDEQFMIEDGYRRWVALHILTDRAECRIRIPVPGEDLVTKAIVTALTTSLHKAGLKPMERARAYGRLRDEGNLTHAKIAIIAGLGESAISASLMLLDLAPKEQARIDAGTLKVKDAVNVIKQYRAKQRQGSGKKPVEVGWEPEHFTKRHHLAKRAKVLCDARDHNNRRRLDGVACGQCFEDAIRQDQTTILQAAYLEAQRDNVNPTFMPPFLGSNGEARAGVVGNGV
jgi:ParB family chromosome partitioning protein